MHSPSYSSTAVGNQAPQPYYLRQSSYQISQSSNFMCLVAAYSQTWLYRIWLYRTTYISLLIPENSAKLSRDNLYESRDYYTGTLFITDFFLSRPYKFFVSGISRFNCKVRCGKVPAPPLIGRRNSAIKMAK
jgi:hypothetical protein